MIRAVADGLISAGVARQRRLGITGAGGLRVMPLCETLCFRVFRTTPMLMGGIGLGELARFGALASYRLVVTA